MDSCVRTYEQLLQAGLTNAEIVERRRRGDLTELLPAVYCSQPVPTTIDKIHAVVAALPGAVMSHGTAAWLHGLLSEPAVVEAYVADYPPWLLPRWLRLYLADFDDDEPGERVVTVPHSGA